MFFLCHSVNIVSNELWTFMNFIKAIIIKIDGVEHKQDLMFDPDLGLYFSIDSRFNESSELTAQSPYRLENINSSEVISKQDKPLSKPKKHLSFIKRRFSEERGEGEQHPNYTKAVWQESGSTQTYWEWTETMIIEDRENRCKENAYIKALSDHKQIIGSTALVYNLFSLNSEGEREVYQTDLGRKVNVINQEPLLFWREDALECAYKVEMVEEEGLEYWAKKVYSFQTS